MEHTAEFLTVIVNERMRSARCAAARERLIHEAVEARKARRTRDHPHGLRRRFGAGLMLLGARIAGTEHPSASPAC